MPVGTPQSGSYEPHAPIAIFGDAQFCDPVLGGALSGVRNCATADGSEDRPYEISGWHILGRNPLTANALTLQSTGLHVVIRDNIIEPLPHEVFSAASLPPLGGSLQLLRTHDVVVEDNLIYGPYPVRLETTSRSEFRGNTIVRAGLVAESAVAISSLDQESVFTDNVVTSLRPNDALGPGFVVSTLSATLDRNQVLNEQNPAYAFNGFAVVDLADAMDGFGDDNTAADCRVVILRSVHDTTYRQDDGECLLGVVDAENVTVSDVKGTNMGLYVWGSRGVVINDVHLATYSLMGGTSVNGARFTGALTISDSQYVTVNDCRVDDGYNQGVAVVRSYDVTFEDCHIAGPAIRLFNCVNSSGVSFLRGSFGSISHQAVLAGFCDRFRLEGVTFAENRPAAREQMSEARFYDSADVDVSGNLFHSTRNGSSTATAIYMARSPRPEIADNTFSTLHGIGVRLLGAPGASVHDNAFHAIGNEAVWFDGGTSGVIESNEITNSSTGVRVDRPIVFLPPPTAIVRQNAIAGNGVGLSIGDAVGPVDARENWWGAADGPSGIGTGSGDPIDTTGPEVLFEPWLTEDPNGVNG